MRWLILVTVLYLQGIHTADLRVLFKEWQRQYGREYDGLRNTIDRFKQFQKSAETIKLINSLQEDWRAGFTMFADMSEEEKRMYTGLNSSLEDPGLPPIQSLKHSEMAKLDLGDPEKKYWEMGPAQNQWSCGSCWAFAAVGALEGRHLKETGVYREFSEQTLLDCVFEGTRDGCDGGWSDGAVRWTSNRNNPNARAGYGYLPAREDNPYKGRDGLCVDNKKPFPNALKHAKPTSWGASYQSLNDAGLQHALATEGPVIVYIYSSWALPFYTTGTFVGTGCGENPTVNHAVVAAGYEKDYWYIKNSWGSSWGYSGYVYFSRSYPNLCSVSSRRKTITWNANQHYDICTDTPERDRTRCVDDRDLPESDCIEKGCCWDSSYSGSKKLQCFAKGKLTVYDSAGHRRVFYGSVADFTDVAFAATATSVQAEYGTWILYADGDWWNSPVKVVNPEDGKVVMNVQSVRLLTTKNTLHLFAYPDFVGNKLTLSSYSDKLEYAFNNDVSSFISYGGPWKLCDGENQVGPCQHVAGPSHFEKKMSLCDDCISSVA